MDSQISQLQQNLEQIAQILNTTAQQLEQCSQQLYSRQAPQSALSPEAALLPGGVQSPMAAQAQAGRHTAQSVNTNFAPTYLDLFSDITLQDVEKVTGPQTGYSGA